MTEATTDPAPWYIRELRPYGLAGLLLAAACWYVFTTNDNQKQQINQKDAIIYGVVGDNAKSNWQLSKSIDDLRGSLKK